VVFCIINYEYPAPADELSELQSCSLSRDNDSCIAQMQISSQNYYNYIKATLEVALFHQPTVAPFLCNSNGLQHCVLIASSVTMESEEATVLKGMLGHKEQ
jgi:hypothetical protein